MHETEKDSRHPPQSQAPPDFKRSSNGDGLASSSLGNPCAPPDVTALIVPGDDSAFNSLDFVLWNGTWITMAATSKWG
jgi:hypothetical protein